MASVSAEVRRAQARDVALQLLGGRRFENLSLRDVARELDIALSTLTYVYSSVTDLLDDFDGYIDEPVMSDVGTGGLRVELGRYVNGAVTVVGGHPGLREIWRYRMTRVGSGSLDHGLVRSEDMITQIRNHSGESYRLPDAGIASAFRWMAIGTLIHWLDSGSGDATEWRDAMRVAIDVLVLAADPHLGGQSPR